MSLRAGRTKTGTPTNSSPTTSRSTPSAMSSRSSLGRKDGLVTSKTVSTTAPASSSSSKVPASRLVLTESDIYEAYPELKDKTEEEIQKMIEEKEQAFLEQQDKFQKEQEEIIKMLEDAEKRLLPLTKRNIEPIPTDVYMFPTVPTKSLSITSLLKQLSQFQKTSPPTVPLDSLVKEIASALSAIFSNNVTATQAAALLTALTFTGLHHDPLVITAVVEVMREAAVKIIFDDQSTISEKKEKFSKGDYKGGFIDIVGTGGDGHNTFNVSTTAALLVAPHVFVCKHGNRASTSTSGSADLLNYLSWPIDVLSLPPKVIPPLLANHSNFAFLFAPTYHPGMRHVASIRKELGFPTLFNVIGPLANPVDGIEARILGVGKKALGPVFIEVLRLMGCQKGMVVCGDVGEGLDEISPSGTTTCWRLRAAERNPKIIDEKATEDGQVDDDNTDNAEDAGLATIEQFELDPERDFGIKKHDLEDCKSRSPRENAEMVVKILKNQVEEGDAVLDYCLINAAAMLVVAGITDNWKEGVEIVKKGIQDGSAMKEWEKFTSGCEVLLQKEDEKRLEDKKKVESVEQPEKPKEVTERVQEDGVKPELIEQTEEDKHKIETKDNSEQSEGEKEKEVKVDQ